MSLQLSTRVNGTPVLNFGSGAIPAGARVVAGCRLTEDAQIYAAVSGTVATYCQGLPFDSDGRLLAAFNSVATYSNGIPLDSSGFLCAGGVVPATWSGGLPFDSDGALAGWSPLYLFSSGANGFVNQLALDTLFTDTAGTTPVTTIGDTIALGLDQSGNSNDMAQATAAARPVYGRMPVSGVRNLLAVEGTSSENLNGVLWGNVGVTSPAANSIIENTTTGVHRKRLEIRRESGKTYTVTFKVKAAGRHLLFLNADDMMRASSAFDLNAGTVTTANGTASIVASTDPDYDWECSATGVATDTGSTYLYYQLNSTQTGPQAQSYTGDGVSGILMSQVQFEEGAKSAYQKVTAAYDVTQPGTQSVPIAYMDTSDDNFSWTLPAGTYHLFIAGDLGCYFDTVVHTGGEFTVGPTSWTGGPDGAITTLIGQRHVIMPVIRDEVFTQSEKELMVAYVMARGGGEVWAGTELFTGTITLGTGWADNGDGSYTHTAGSEGRLITGNSVDAADFVLVDFTISGQTTGLTQIVTNTNDAISPAYGSNGERYLVAAAAATGPVAIRSTSSSDATVSDISLKALTRNTDPYP